MRLGDDLGLRILPLWSFLIEGHGAAAMCEHTVGLHFHLQGRIGPVELIASHPKFCHCKS